MKILHTADWHLGLELHGVSLLDARGKWFAPWPRRRNGKGRRPC